VAARKPFGRGDRGPGHAAAQERQVRAHGVYDIECDTTATGPLHCALAIGDFLARRPVPGAFDRLRSDLL